MVVDWDHFYFCNTPVNKLAAIVANQRNCGEQVAYDPRVLKLVVKLVDITNAIKTATPAVSNAMRDIPISKKFKLTRLDDLAKIRKRLKKKDRCEDANTVHFYMDLVAQAGHTHAKIRAKQQELGIIHNISSRQTARVAKGRADALCK
tara:strand:- start:5664 stop:6107 length:444 start_codon:yes stop_codon:yes gene_type:complete